MATGENDQLKSGDEDYSWGTDGETIGPPPSRNQPRGWATPEQQEQQQIKKLKARHATIVAESY